MSLFNPFPIRVTDATGRPIAYALVAFYAAGTSDYVEVFSDSALSVPRLNPVPCGGIENPGLLPETFVSDDRALRVVWMDEGGATIFDADNISPSAPARMQVVDVTGAAKLYGTADIGKITRRAHSGAMGDTLPAAASAGNGAYLAIWNDSAFSLVLSVTGGGTIDGLASITLRSGQRVDVLSDGTEWVTQTQALGFGPHLVSLPAGFWDTRPTNSAAYNKKDLAASNRSIREWLFDPATEEGMCGRFTVPIAWDGLPFDASIKWNSNVALGATVRFGIRARVVGNAEDLNLAYGALGTVDDASQGAGTGDGYELQSDWFTVTPASIGGTNGGKTLMLEVVRPVFGTLAADVGVSDVVLRFGINKANDS